jgi:FK506-binding protein 4/5
MAAAEDLPTKMDVDEPATPEAGNEEDVTGDGGVMKKIIKEGEGWKTAQKGFEVSVHYVGKLLDGTVFDSSRERGEYFKFKVGSGSVIKGWEKAIKTMKRKEIALVTCKPEYAYGEAGSPPTIPPNATLQFEIELVDWMEETDVSQKKDQGVLKKVLKEGDGWEKPKDDTKVKGKQI